MPTLDQRWSKKLRSDVSDGDDDFQPTRRDEGGFGGGRPSRGGRGGGRRRYNDGGAGQRQFYGLAQGSGAVSKRFRGYDPENPSGGRGGGNRGRDRSRSRDRGSGGRSKGQPQKKLFIGNLSFDTAEGDLKSLFAKYGDIADLFIPKNAEGESKGFGFVEFDDIESATEAVNDLDGSDFNGRRLGLEYAKPRERDGGSFGGGGRTMRGYGRSPPRNGGGRSSWRGRGGGGGSGSFRGRGGGRSRGGRGGGRGRGRGRDSDFNKGPVDNKALDDDLDAYFGRKEASSSGTAGTSGGGDAAKLDSELDDYFNKSK